MSRCTHALVLADSRHQLIFCIIYNPALWVLAAGATYLMKCTSASVNDFTDSSEQTNVQDFQARLRGHLRHLNARGMRYRPLG